MGWAAPNQKRPSYSRWFPEDQLYVVFLVAGGGVDLEHFDVRSFAETRSMHLQAQ